MIGRRAGVALIGMALLVGGCASARTTTRAVELDAGIDVAFRAAAATLLDDRQVFDLSDRDAGLVVGVGRGGDYVARRTTIWVTPMEGSADERCFVILQVFGVTTAESHAERLDWLLARMRQRCILGGAIEPIDEEGAEDSGGDAPDGDSA